MLIKANKFAFSILELAFAFVALSVALAALVPLISKNVKNKVASTSFSSPFKTGECSTLVSSTCVMCIRDKNESNKYICIDCELEECPEGQLVDYKECKCVAE